MESSCSYVRIDKSTHINYKITAFLALFVGTSANYLLSLQSSTPNLSNLAISFGYLVFLVTMGLFHLYNLRSINGSWPSLYPGSILSKSNSLAPGFTVGLIGGVFVFFAQFALIFGYYYDPAGAGIIVLLLTAITPVTSILAFFFYRERFTLMQIAGMVVCLSGVAYIGVGSLEGSWVGYVCGLVCMLLFSIRNVTGRTMEEKGLDIYTSGMLNAFGEVLTSGVFLGYLVATDGLDFSVDTNQLLMLLGGGVLMAYSQYYINQACMTGNIGVVCTIINTMGILLIGVKFVHTGDLPEVAKLIACVVVFFGVVVMLFGDEWLKCCKKQSTYHDLSVN
jgi:drug/metabolite transporter (DMT)-like permease